MAKRRRKSKSAKRRRPRCGLAARDRGGARRRRARHPHAADRHPRARRIARRLRSRPARTAMGAGRQERRRASRRAVDAHRRCRARRCGGTGAAARAVLAARAFGMVAEALAARAANKWSRSRSRSRPICRPSRWRRVALARGAREPRRQRGQVHARRRRALRRCRRAGAGQTRPARFRLDRQRHRHERRRNEVLFRPFAQASAEIARRYGGAGLGLTFVKRIAKAMGGDLTVTSAGQAARSGSARWSIASSSPPVREGRAAAGRALGSSAPRTIRTAAS